MLVASGWQAICASRRVPVFPGLSPHPCALIQRNRFSLTHAMDTLIPSSRPPIPINFTDRRNIPETRWELTTRVGTRQRTRIGESGNDLRSFTIAPFVNFSPFLFAVNLSTSSLASGYPSGSRRIHLSKYLEQNFEKDHRWICIWNLRVFERKERSRLSTPVSRITIIIIVQIGM